MPWTVSCFVKRDGRWERRSRVVHRQPDPAAVEAAMGDRVPEAVVEKLRAAIHEILGVRGEHVQGESIAMACELPPRPSDMP